MPKQNTTYTAVRGFLRYFIALVLLSTAIGKLLDIQGFAAAIETYQIFSGWITAPLGLSIALIELALAIWLFSGRNMKLAAVAAIVLHLGFIVWLFIAMGRGLDIPNCGCYGVFWARPLDWITIVEDLVLLAASSGLYVLTTMDKRAKY